MRDATAFEKTIAGRADALALDAIRKSGKTAISQTPQQQGEWRAAILPVQKQMEPRIGRDLLEAIDKEVALTRPGPWRKSVTKSRSCLSTNFTRARYLSSAPSLSDCIYS